MQEELKTEPKNQADAILGVVAKAKDMDELHTIFDNYKKIKTMNEKVTEVFGDTFPKTKVQAFGLKFDTYAKDYAGQLEQTAKVWDSTGKANLLTEKVQSYLGTTPPNPSSESFSQWLLQDLPSTNKMAPVYAEALIKEGLPEKIFTSIYEQEASKAKLIQARKSSGGSAGAPLALDEFTETQLTHLRGERETNGTDLMTLTGKTNIQDALIAAAAENQLKGFSAEKRKVIEEKRKKVEGFDYAIQIISIAKENGKDMDTARAEKIGMQLAKGSTQGDALFYAQKLGLIAGPAGAADPMGLFK
jgi:hypothetical protein